MGQAVVHYVEHGTGRPVLVLHGAGVDHREAEACFEPALDGVAGLRRIYPDLPGMGRTTAPETLRSADDVLDTLLDFADEVVGGAAHLLIGHSAGAYYAQAMAARRPAQVAGLALVCPLLPGLRDVPEHRVVAGSGEIGERRLPELLRDPDPGDARTVRTVTSPQPPRSSTRRRSSGSANGGRSPPITRRRTRVRQWSWRGGWTRRSGMPPPPTSLDHYPHASLAVVDDAGHALPHEQPELLRALLAEWLVARRALELTRNSYPRTPPASSGAAALGAGRRP